MRLKFIQGKFGMFQKILEPAILIINKLAFKSKILLISAVLFFPMIIPTFNTIVFNIDENKVLNRQITGLDYNVYNYKILQLLALHRDLTNSYLYGNLTLKDKILKIEDDLDSLESNYLEYDKKNLNIFRGNTLIIEMINRWEFLKLNSLSAKKINSIFMAHTKLIIDMIDLEKLISQKSHFSASYNTELNYVSKLLGEKIPSLTEMTARLRGMGAGVFSKNSITEKEQTDMLELISIIGEKVSFIQNSKPLIYEKNYIELNKLSQEIVKKFKSVTMVFNAQMLENNEIEYDFEKFFTLVSDVIKAENNYYDVLAELYKEQSTQNLESNKKTLFWLFAGLFFILVGFIYIFTAFYTSVVKSLEKLKLASSMVADGKYNTTIYSNTNDEIGDAIDAFNNMSYKLSTNIAFLDAYKLAIDETSIVSKADSKGIITYVNKRFCEVSGFSQEELIGRPHNMVRHPDMSKSTFNNLWQTIKNKKTWKGILKNITKDGGFYIVDATIIPIFDKEGNIIEYVGVRHDITALEMQKEKQKIDELTLLPNKLKLDEDLHRYRDPVLMRINLNNFSNLNDFYGYKIGDKVLVSMAKLLTSLSKTIGFTTYKLHADDFAFVFERGYHTRETFENIIVKIIKDIETADIICDENSCINIKVTAGVALLNDKKTLFSDANIALKNAKMESRSYRIYDASMRNDDDYVKNMIWIKKIQNAIADNRIRPYFQPIIDNETGNICKYEALVRLVDEGGTINSPYLFLEIAKKANLYPQITKIIVDKAFKEFEDKKEFEFSINLTIEDILNTEIVEYLLYKLANYETSHRVIFEIVESEEIENYNAVNSFIKKVKEYGVKIAIDDFGSGYANFEHILLLDVDYIKIDGSLIKNIDRDRNSLIITEAIIEFSKKLNCKTVVEYVHNEEIYDIVRAYGADYSQGFYLGEPSLKPQGLEKV
jgi:PAS domain S-box-containing protein/diguanylate cyclase (GGDEF)-like protein